MDTKNRIIQKLLKAAKKHKILTYPVLALVAVISAISNLFSWSTGAGKRIVAVIMVMVMLVSQSYFLTSSATEAVDNEETALVQQELQQEVMNQEVEESIKEDKSVKDSTESTTEVAKSTEEAADTDTADIAEDFDIIEDETMNTVSTDDQVAVEEYTVSEDSAAAGSETTETDNTDDNTDTYDNIEIIDEETIDSQLDSGDLKKKVNFIFNYPKNDEGDSFGGLGEFIESEELVSADLSNYTFKILDKANDKLSTFNNSSEYTVNDCYTFEDAWYSDSSYSKKYTDEELKAFVVSKDVTEVELYAKRILARYFVEVDSNVDKIDSATFQFGEEAINATETSCYVKITDGKAQLTLKNFNRNGYNAKAPLVSLGEVSFDDESGVATVTFSGTSVNKKVTLQWTGKPYTIKYAYNAEDTEPTPKTVYYGSESTDHILDMSGTAEDREGYEYDCWSVGNGTDAATVSPGMLIKNDPDLQHDLFEASESGTPIVLYPQYTYAGIVLSGTGGKEASADFVYSEKKSVTIQGKYNKTGAKTTSENFSYEITSSNASSIEHDYGISVTPSPSGVILNTNGPIKTTGTSYITVEFKIKDKTATDINEGYTTGFKINIKIDQKVVKILDIADGSNVKTYDGNDIAHLNSKILATDTEGVTVEYTDANYNSLKVAEAKYINLKNANIIVEGDETNTLKDNYKLASESVPGTIEKRPVWVTTSAVLSSYDQTLGYVRAGEDDPEFKITKDESKGKVTSTMGLVGNDTEADLGVTLTSDRPSDKTKTGTFSVTGNASSDTNYEVMYSAIGTYTVTQESPDGKYSYNSDKMNEDGWYVGEQDGDVSIIANSNSGYSAVYIYRNGSDTPDKSGKLKEEDSNDTTLRIQLVDPKSEDGLSGTGAITSIRPLTVKFQHSAPQFVGYKIIDIEDVEYDTYGGYQTGLYFPKKGSVLNFGTYIGSMIKLEIEYSDKTSKMKELHYTLFNSSKESDPVAFDDDGKAVIQIYKEAVLKLGKNPDTTTGIIECYGVNNAGIQSGSTKLCPTNDNDSSYEWSIETGIPQINPLIVYSDNNKDTRRIVADQSGVAENQMAYYNHCQASVSVSDAVSGLESVTWYINSDDEDNYFAKDEIHENKKIESGTYTLDITGLDSEICSIYAIIQDNAGNSVKTNTVKFRIDDVTPEVKTDYKEAEWTSDTTISFTASDDLSGVDYIKVSDENGKTIDCDIQKPDSITGEYIASFKAEDMNGLSKKGTYTAVVADKAGNIKTQDFNVQNISTIVPPCPDITISPEVPNGNDGWYNADSAAPVAKIKRSMTASDNTPVTAEYRLWKEGETGYNDTPITGESIDVPINDEGVFNVKAWAKSVSGVECADYNDHVKIVKVDRTAPDILISTEKGSESSIIVNFDVTDNVSGVDAETVSVEHGGNLVDITIEVTDDGVHGSFEIDETGNYTIKASDIAGNVSDEAAFTPMSLKVKAVTNISDDGASIAANVIKGTFDIKSAAISYRKYTDDKYTEAETIVNINSTTGNATASTVLSGLEPATAYVFKVTATSDVNEVLEYEGYFKTLSLDQSGITVYGTARYSDNSSGEITVGIFEGNVCLMAEEIEAGEEFSFVNVPDGNYNIVATDGIYSKTSRLLIEDGMIQYPTQYIDLVLSGMNTSVVITTESTPGVTVDDMDSIFLDDTVNFTTKDSELIDAGGTVEFKLYATLMTVSAVSADEISAMYAVTDNNKVVGAYLDLSLYKIVTDVSGDVDRSRVTNLANPAHISVTIPLGDLAGKPDLEVVRIHNDGENFIGASLSDQDSNPNTYTITTDQFSTYAVLYSIDSATTESTKTTEKDATTATTKETGKTTTEKPAASTATTQQINVEPINQSGTTVTSTEASTQASTAIVYEDDDEDVKEIKSKSKKPKASGTTSVGSLTSSGTAKTGDEAPIMIIFAFMMISICGVVILRKRFKDID